MVKGTDRIRLDNGEVVTMSEALDKGLLELRKSSGFYSKGKTVTAYFADVPGTRNGWRITPGLYKSRMGLSVV